MAWQRWRERQGKRDGHPHRLFNDTEKRLGLPVPYGCALHDIQAEAEKAMRELSDIAKIAVNLPK